MGKKYRFPSIKNGEEFEMPRITQGDLEAMLRAQVEIDVNAKNEMAEMLYGSAVGMRVLAERILKRIDPNVKIDEMPAEEYIDFLEALQKEHPKLFKQGGSENFPLRNMLKEA